MRAGRNFWVPKSSCIRAQMYCLSYGMILSLQAENANAYLHTLPPAIIFGVEVFFRKLKVLFRELTNA